eukprot:TRINITY_DN3243_c0_g2_i3.p1 TRINITY_DN3243_c0_g2~~TRINITY_DN3243_c0_g2_i3.p1  ORF type:complete len:2505 (-),score=353.87 TRINITY_DN3243_c0_g2_i3:4186-11700(-)
MKRIIHFKSYLLMLISLILLSGSIFAQGYENGLRQGVVRVKFKPQISATLNSVQPSSVNGVLHTGIQPFDKVNSKLRAVSMKRVFPYSAKHEAKHKKYGLDLWYEVTYTSGANVMEAASGYANLNEVGVAEPIVEKIFAKGPVTFEAPSTSANMPFNDPLLSKQWHYNNKGELSQSVVGGDINLFDAWEIEKGKPNVVVCIVDGGIDTDHEDLAANMWVNKAEANGIEGIDDDGNGYIDDIHGYNFITDRGELTDHYHGTHVAGTVAAVNNNRLGVAGVAGGSGSGDGVRLMSAQIFSNEGSSSDAATAIVYGADNGAVISQNSWGYRVTGYYEQAIHDAIDYFVAEAGDFEGSPMKGGLVFFAAGNEYKEGLYYPGCYEGAISVSALGPDNLKAAYSNYGTWVDIAAPGGNNDYGDTHGVLSTLPDNKYGYLDGTSMACPHVSGVAALVVSKFGNSTFTNEDLKTHILTGVHDIDELNPEYAGKLGVGYLDALMALGTDNGLAPDAIDDFTLVGIAQDFASLSWTVPSDEDDVLPVSMEILYSTEELSVDNISSAEKLTLDIIPTDEIGTLREFDLTGLKAESTYYFAIRSTDRWGNISDLSNIITGTTNAGPAINTDKAELNLTIDASQSVSLGDNFTILNEAEGILQWDGSVRQKSYVLAYNSTGLNYPEISTSSSSTELMSQAVEIEELKAPGITPFANFKEEIIYGVGHGYVIGDTDINITNSSATRFEVTNEEGFNLTEISSFIQHTPATGPVIMEIYQGEEMLDKNLILAQEVTSYKTLAYWHNIKLDEQLYFEKGSVFWVVFHVPAGNLYPLGVYSEVDPGYSDNCFISFNLGNTWEKLGDAMNDHRYVWATKAVSKNKHLGNYITLDPNSGSVEGNSSQEVALSVDASTLINGDYKANVVLQSNDAVNPTFRVPVNLKVEGHKPILNHDAVIDFGSVFYGLNKTLSFTLENVGYGNLVVASTQVSDDQFVVGTRIRRLNARNQIEVTVTFEPTSVGPQNATYTILDRNGDSHVINLYGNSVATSEIVLTPANQDLGDMGVGETAQTSFVISNDGQYPLEYVIPSFAPDVNLDGMDKMHKYGYSVESNLLDDTSAEFVWDDISNNNTDVTQFFKSSAFDHKYKEANLGFEFPFYGETYKKIYLTRYGILALEGEGGLGHCMPAKLDPYCTPEGFIAAFFQEFDINLGGEIKYALQPGKFIVEYTNVLRRYERNPDNGITFQMVLFQNGDIELRYKDIEKYSSYFIKTAMMAIADPLVEDPLLVQGYRTNKDGIYAGLKDNETIVRFKSPGESMITSVSEPSGVVPVGESKTIDVELSTDGLYESATYQRLVIASNDPHHNPTAFTVHVNVNTGGEADLQLDKTAVDLGTVFQAGESRDVIVLTNDGTKDVNITGLNMTGDRFLLGVNAPLVLKPKSWIYVPIELNTSDLGDFSDVLTIETDANKTFAVSLAGEVVHAPGIMVDVTPIEKTLEAGEKTSAKILVKNDGEADLELLAYGTDWLYEAEPVVNTPSLKEFSYYHLTNVENEGPVYNWEDIRRTGTIISVDEWGEIGGVYNLWKAVALPFEMEFYQQKTDSIWVSWMGVISMSKPTMNGIHWPAPLLGGEEPNNIIAPYYAQQNFDYANFPDEAGVVYEIFDDRVIVQWSECQDGFGMGDNYHFAAILYKNGNIKFQYKLGASSMTRYGAVGIKNADGTDAIQLAYMQDYLNDGFAVSFTPSEKMTIPVGGEKEFTVAIDAEHLNKGVYNSDFTLVNNTPTNSEVKVPVQLTVNGEADMGASVEAFDFGTVMAYEVIGDFGPEQKAYIQEFLVQNTGRDVLNFTDIKMQYGSEAATEIYYIDPWWGWGDWVPVTTSKLASLKPGESAKLRMALRPYGTNTDVIDTLIFSGNLPDGEFRLPVNALVALPPVLAVDQDTISVVANTPEDVLTRSFVIDNSDGKSVLDYEIDIAYNRKGEGTTPAAASNNTVITEALVSEFDIESAISAAIKPFAEESYHATLEYDTLTVPANALGFGEARAFITGTAFQAPSEGFNLTHVKTWYYYQDILESSITVEIRAGGTSVADAKVLSRESFDVVVDNPQEFGEYFTFKLTDKQVFFPGETFYVVFEYPLGAAAPQAMSKGVENVAGRFMYSNGADWGDLQASGYRGEGWMVKAMEKEHKTRSWAVIDGATSGSVAVGESVTVNVNFLASDAVDATNDAVLTVATNDPVNPEAIVNLNMRLNQGPQFTLESDLIVRENDSLSFVVTASDLEGDVCTYALDEAYEFLQMTQADSTFNFIYTPDFESAGVHSFFLTGIDSYGNETNLEIPIEVINVNRAPEVINPIATREYYEDGEYDEINLTEVFADPDGDEMTYIVSLNNESCIDVFVADEAVVIKSFAEGEAVVNVYATDSQGLSTRTSFEVIVGTVTGIEDIEGTGTTKVYPVPTNGPLNIVLGSELEGDVNISVMNVVGLTQYQTTVNKGKGEYTETLDISNLPSGIYMVNIRTAKEVIVKKVIKK